MNKSVFTVRATGTRSIGNQQDAPAAPGAPPGSPGPQTTTAPAALVSCELEALPKVGNVNGMVRDAESGAAIGGATVKITDKLGRSLNLASDAGGKVLLSAQRQDAHLDAALGGPLAGDAEQQSASSRDAAAARRQTSGDEQQALSRAVHPSDAVTTTPASRPASASSWWARNQA